MNTVPLYGWAYGGRVSPADLLARMGVDSSRPERLAATLPYSLGDATCGTENELQAVVIGSRESVDLPQIIEGSNYFKNMIKRQQRGELPRRMIGQLEAWLSDNPSGVWENSWVRLARRRLSPLASRLVQSDLLSDKKNPAAGRRNDAGRFMFKQDGEEHLRVPVSYLLKLALVDVIGGQKDLCEEIRNLGLKLSEHFISDNTSPETHSFHLVSLTPETGNGRAAAAETARRFLLTQLLVQYAGQGFGLLESGQKVAVYFSPHPPVRKKILSNLISDSFYRELFMNPCLSGWDRGEEKHKYMHLCHQVLSRAQLNSLGHLKEAGLIANNLVVLPSASNISLLNNGTHVSLGSRMMTGAMAENRADFGPEHEKYFADLVIKFVEHFLPLFVRIYSGAPYRIDYNDLHPERMLSFLVYQLDYTHLRMIWRRWKKKAHTRVKPFGFNLRPFGPEWLDGNLSRLLRLKGDFVPDFRLIDYLVGVMSTDQSPSLDGRLGNQERLKQDLAQLGVFDPSMPLYLPFRQRAFQQMGFSGFEGRIYSLFDSLFKDLGPAVELQCLVTALAYQMAAGGKLLADHIPDGPEVESERRQVLFCSAIGLPTFYVRQDTANAFLAMLLKRTPRIRSSRRYPGYLRVRMPDYLKTLVMFLCEEAPALIECLDLSETIQDLLWRLEYPERRSATGKLTKGIMKGLGARRPLDEKAAVFNRAAEDYYREELKKNHLKEAWEVLENDIKELTRSKSSSWAGLRDFLSKITGGKDVFEFVESLSGKVILEKAEPDELVRLINLVLLTIYNQIPATEREMNLQSEKGEILNGDDHSSLHRPANRQGYR